MAMKQEIQDIILETLSFGIPDITQQKALQERLTQQMEIVEDGFTITFTDAKQERQMDMNFFAKEIEEMIGVDTFGYQLKQALQAAKYQGLEVDKSLTKIYPFKLTGMEGMIK